MWMCAPWAATRLADDRRRFLRHVLCQAQMEFRHAESPSKVVDTTLLTAMGAMGAECGFSSWCRSGADYRHVGGRGLDDEVIRSIDGHFDHLMDCCFKGGNSATEASCGDVRILTSFPALPGFSDTKRPAILIGWRTSTDMAGLMGVGATLRTCLLTDNERDFLYHLVDHMLMAMRAIDANALLHSLSNELDQARQSVADVNLHNDTLTKELEETRFRLSGFDDIFHELSGLTESVKVMEAFLLVLLGIFSARSGVILYADQAGGKSHAAMRGAGTTLHHTRPETIRDTLASIVGSRFGVHGGEAQVAAMPPELCKGLDPFVPRNKIGVFFQIDGDARGVVCLGDRLVEAPYGATEQELLQVFTHTFLAFLRNSRSVETIAQLHSDQQQKTIALEKTVQALSESRLTIANLERAGERIKAAITKSMRRTTRTSVADILMILLAGIVLGVVYNFASPTGISLFPNVWQFPTPARVGIDDVRARLAAGEILLVDARPTELYDQRRIRDALNLPLALFDFVYMMRFSNLDPQRPIVVYGRTISRHYDDELAHKLTQRGHRHVLVLIDGLSACQARGLEVSP